MRLDVKNPSDDAVIYMTMWATCLLAITDILLKTPWAKLHLNALRELFTYYVRVKPQTRMDRSPCFHSTLTPSTPA